MLWDGKTRQPLPSPPLPSGSEIRSFRLLPDGQTVAYSYAQGTGKRYQDTVVTWNYRTNREQWRYKNAATVLASLQTSPDGKWLMAFEVPHYDSFKRDSLYLFDKNGQVRHTFSRIGFFTRWSGDSKQLATILSKTDSSRNVVSNSIEIHRIED